MVLKVTRTVLLFVFFNVFIYFVHSSIGSLGKIDLLTGNYKKLNEEKQARYRRALQESQLDFQNNSEKVTIRKCCQKTQILNGALQCTDTDKEENIGAFFPSRMIIDKNFDKLYFNFSTNIEVLDDENKCRDLKIILKEDGPLHHFIIFETGELLEMDGEKVVSNYSGHYCLDILQNDNQRNFVLMLCLCKEIMCIQKCCPAEEYFNTVTNKCTKNIPDGKTLKLDFYEDDERVIYSVKHLLINRPLNCSNKPDDLIKNVNDSHDVFVQADGNLMHALENGKEVTDVDNYCLDVFSDGNQSQTNGFYCKGVQNKRTARGSPQSLSKCCKEGESLNTNFECRKHKKNVTVWKPSPLFLGSTFTELEYKGFTITNDDLSVKLKIDDFVEQNIKGKRSKIYIKDILNTFDSSMFCIDNYLGKESDFGVIFTPCEKKTCLQKCCPYGFFFNVNMNECVKDNRISRQTIEVITFKEAQEVTRSADVFLIHNETTCPGFEKELYSNAVGNPRLSIQENGNIVTQKEKHRMYVWTRPLGYCVDLFSDGTVGLVNGFYCSFKKSRRGRKIWREKKSGIPPLSSTTKRILNEVFIILLGLIITL